MYEWLWKCIWNNLFKCSFFSASRKSNVNPDNVATPIAASLGDLVTLAILAHSANLIYHLDTDGASYFKPKLSYPIIILVIYGFLVIPFCLKLAKMCTSTNDLLSKGWTPVLSAMVSHISPPPQIFIIYIYLYLIFNF